MSETIVTTVPMERLADMIETALIKAVQKESRNPPEHLYTRAEAARKMGKAYNTIDRMILQGRIKATADGKYISQKAIDEYLNMQK